MKWYMSAAMVAAFLAGMLLTPHLVSAGKARAYTNNNLGSDWNLISAMGIDACENYFVDEQQVDRWYGAQERVAAALRIYLMYDDSFHVFPLYEKSRKRR